METLISFLRSGTVVAAHPLPCSLIHRRGRNRSPWPDWGGELRISALTFRDQVIETDGDYQGVAYGSGKCPTAF